MITEKDRLTIRYGYKIEYCENNRFLSSFIKRIEIIKKAKKETRRKKLFVSLWNCADCSNDADFYFAFLKLHLPEFYK